MTEYECLTLIAKLERKHRQMVREMPLACYPVNIYRVCQQAGCIACNAR